MNTRSPLTRKELIDEYFIENRTRLLEIAAFLDRLDRAGAATGGADDFRMQAFSEALAAVASGTGNRLTHVQMLLSDPTTEPLQALDRKSALGAYNRQSSTVRPLDARGVVPSEVEGRHDGRPEQSRGTTSSGQGTRS